MHGLLKPLPLIALAIAAGCSEAPPPPAPLNEGTWNLDGASSQLSFVTVKSGEVIEAHSFKDISGSVAPDGTAVVDIKLASLDTGVEIRDQRMGEFLFETAKFPSATVTAKIDPASFANLKVGETMKQPVSTTLELHGVKSPIDTELSVTRAGPDSVLVTNTKPIIVDANTYGMTAGVDKLRELAGLPAITPSVSVTFALDFKR